MERSDKPGLIHAAGGATLIWVDYAQQKAVDLPERIRALVGAT
jgi:acyl-CoA thioester hydrolase